MMDILKEAKEFAGLFGVQSVVIFLLLSPFIWWVRQNYNVFLKPLPVNEEDQKRRLNDLQARRQWVETRSFEKRYLDLLGQGLDWVAERLIGDSKKLVVEPDSRGKTGRLFAINPFTEQSYDFTLRLALVYPILAFILAWMFGGGGAFVGFQLLPDIESGLVRGVLVVGFFVSVWFFLKGSNSEGWSSLLFFVSAVVFAVVFIFVFIFAVAVAGAGAVAGTGTGAGAGAGTFIGAVAFAVAFSFSFSFAAAFAFAFAFAAAAAAAVAAALAFSFSFSFPLALTLAFSFAVVVVVAFIVVIVLRESLHSSKAILVYWIGNNLILLVLLVVVLVWVAPRTNNSEALLLLVFIGLLPLANAALDWLSLGFTRGLLYNIRHGHHAGGRALLWAGFDIVLALVFLFSIASLTTLLLASVNAISLAVGGKAVMDLVSLFDGLKASPGALEYSWIHFMMLSTLIPTLLHFFIASFALVLILPNQARVWILAQWNERSDARHAAFFYVSFVPVLGLLGPLALLWGLWVLLSTGGGAVGWALLDWVRAIAEFVDPSFSV